MTGEGTPEQITLKHIRDAERDGSTTLELGGLEALHRLRSECLNHTIEMFRKPLKGDPDDAHLFSVINRSYPSRSRISVVS